VGAGKKRSVAQTFEKTSRQRTQEKKEEIRGGFQEEKIRIALK